MQQTSVLPEQKGKPNFLIRRQIGHTIGMIITIDKKTAPIMQPTMITPVKPLSDEVVVAGE